LSSARLVKWTKGFKCSGVENEDVVALLHQAIQRRQVDRANYEQMPDTFLQDSLFVVAPRNKTARNKTQCGVLVAVLVQF